MLLPLALGVALLAGSSQHPVDASRTATVPTPRSMSTSTSTVVELGLSAPTENLEAVDAFARQLARRLVWTVSGPGGDGAGRIDAGAPETAALSLRFTVVRLDRGRVTASYQSSAATVPAGLHEIVRSVGRDEFFGFPDVCLSADDPPARVRVLGGRHALGVEALERAIAGAARSARLDGPFGLERAVPLEWGRHVVLVFAAASADVDHPVSVRPLILVLERV